MYSLVAVSGGSDSMALLDMLRREGKKLIVCHVNYGFRESSNRDEDIVRKYCSKYNLKLEILKNVKYDKDDGNLENFARVMRYDFFKKVYYKYGCDCLYVGHNKDDLIETYYIQKKRDAKCDYYGLKEENFMYEMVVKRTLLSFSKDELKKYCDNNNIEYGVDETNFDNSYLRNNIRHNVVLKMSEEEKKQVLDEIRQNNVFKQKEYETTHNLLNNCKVGNNKLDLKEFFKLSEEDRVSVIYYFIIEIVKVKISISDKRIRDILNKIKSNKPNIELGRFNDYILYKEYEKLVIKREEKEFSYIIDRLDCCIEDFYIDVKGNKLEKVVVSKDMFPLRIENYRGDNKEINRLFIDKKIPVSERKTWPVVYDKLGNVLLVLNIKKFYNNKDSMDNIVEFYIRKKEKERI